MSQVVNDLFASKNWLQVCLKFVRRGPTLSDVEWGYHKSYEHYGLNFI